MKILNLVLIACLFSPLTARAFESEFERRLNANSQCHQNLGVQNNELRNAYTRNLITAAIAKAVGRPGASVTFREGVGEFRQGEYYVGNGDIVCQQSYPAWGIGCIDQGGRPAGHVSTATLDKISKAGWAYIAKNHVPSNCPN
ncbi:MAG: hypothetical protein ACXVA9_12955 [Bdellovibrionales bacterium]